MAPNAMTVQANPTSTGTKVSSAPKDATMPTTDDDIELLSDLQNIANWFKDHIGALIDLAIIALIVYGWLWLCAN